MVTIIGIDIGGTKTAVVEGTCDAQIIGRHEILTNARRPFAETFPELAAVVEATMEEARRAGRRVGAISVSVGGPVQIPEGVLGAPPQLPGWHGVPLKAQLEKRFPGIPVRIEHDGNAGALAEFHCGVGRELPGLRHLIFLTMGTGLGAGFILNGQLFRGASGTAGEVGHMRLARHGPFAYGKTGSWEGLASGFGLVQLAKEMFPSRWKDGTPVHDLIEAILKDDEEAMWVAHEAGTWLGRGMALCGLSMRVSAIPQCAMAQVGSALIASSKTSLALTYQ